MVENSGADGEIVMEADWKQIKLYTSALPE
jgi:hypothetical protein